MSKFAMPSAKPTVESMTDDLLNIRLLPRLLRVVGASTLIAAVSLFLFQGWDEGNDIYRYFLLLGHSVMLTVVGFASGHYLKESKGARLLVTLAMASVPANFAILGAFIYSQTHAGNHVVPSFVLWEAASMSEALMALACAALLLVPVVLLGFHVLARNSARSLSWVFLAGNAALLLPVRDAISVSLLMLTLVAVVLYQNHKMLSRDATLRTWEGAIARLLMFVPAGVVFGRTAWLYSGDVFTFTVVAIIVFVMLRQLSLALENHQRLRRVLEAFSVITAMCTGIGVVFCADQMLRIGSDAMVLPLFTLTVAGMVFEMSLRSVGDGSGYRRFAAGIVALGVLSQLALFGGVLSATLCLAVGLGLLVYGYTLQSRIVFALGLVMLLAGIGYQLMYAVEMFNLGSWSSLAGWGVVAIVAASALERYGTVLRAKAARMKQQFSAWQH